MFKTKPVTSEKKSEEKVQVTIPLKAGQPTVRTSRQWILPDVNSNYEWLITSRTDSDQLTIYKCRKPEKAGYGYQETIGINIPQQLVHAIADAMLQAYGEDN